MDKKDLTELFEIYKSEIVSEVNNNNKILLENISHDFKAFGEGQQAINNNIKELKHTVNAVSEKVDENRFLINRLQKEKSLV